MDDAIAILPARFASTRFPGKMLADRTGKPLIQHVVEQARKARCLSRVIVAADDPRIVDALRPFGTEVIMTRTDHPNGTSRLAEAAVILSDSTASDVIVNVQGDEPEIDPDLIDETVDAFVSSGCKVGTLATPLRSQENPADPNLVKVVRDANGRAMYFSRSVIPYDRDHIGLLAPLKHVGLYVYQRAFLLGYSALPVTLLERTEQLEQLRVLYHGIPIHVHLSTRELPPGVDTPQQYEEFVRRYAAKHN